MKISAVIITFNEEDRLPDALKSLMGVADEIVVVDSYSTDRTPEIARQAGAILYQNRFEDYGRQKNFAMQKASHDWVLNLDADERIALELGRAITQLKKNNPSEEITAFAINRKAFYLGRWINHSGWYPDKKVRLFRKANALWQGRVHERLVVAGETGFLPGAILHYTYRNIADHARRLNHYSSLQAEEILKQKKKFLLVRVFFLPSTTFIRHYFIKLGFLDGLAGFVIALLSSWATALKYLKAIELKRSNSAL